MAKHGLEAAKIGGVLSQVADRRGWTLCIGAGTSMPAFPSWSAIVGRLIGRTAWASEEASARAGFSEFGLDAAIQAIGNRAGWTEAEKVDALADALYRDFLDATANAEERKAISSTLSAGRLASAPREAWVTLLRYVESKYPNITALALARVVAETRGKKGEVSRIITFNAEPLLASLVQALLHRPRYAASEPFPPAGEMTQDLDLVTHTFSHRASWRIPYFFCHGAIPVPEVNPRISAHDKLVWSESEYLALSNSNYSWQSGVFLDACASTSVVFVGVSLTDPNMRRWLAWTHSLRVSELEIATRLPVAESAPHYWLRVRPTDRNAQPWIESVVAHLGVRVVWMDSWADVEPTLRRMLA